jgi:hypothetical protein
MIEMGVNYVTFVKKKRYLYYRFLNDICWIFCHTNFLRLYLRLLSSMFFSFVLCLLVKQMLQKNK